jgi:hypothetical protein
MSTTHDDTSTIKDGERIAIIAEIEGLFVSF